MVAAWCPLIVLHYAAKAWVVRLPSFSPKPAVTKAVALSASACLARRRTSTCQGCGMVSVYWVVMLGVGCRGTLARLVGCGAVRLLAFRDLRAGTKATGTRTATYAPKSWLLPRAIGVRLNRKKTVANPLSLPPVYAHGAIYPGPSAQGRSEGLSPIRAK